MSFAGLLLRLIRIWRPAPIRIRHHRIIVGIAGAVAAHVADTDDDEANEGD